ncbi:Zn-ribbon domain-containing OB-fold protein [Ferrovibrio sp.]|uniref:Zn-ribbon domain-containing OB-fold protein n=1 Tax=Ferrovibrio sp. TaxID=1917215 RepID=UPI001BC2E287|nr:OB-fold domain-containing protein [Ferrovibrio sp.]MBS4049485.1 OB-fold domain-containing protein [Alphaproteobacteria bacterium]
MQQTGWVSGAESLTYQRCGTCRHVWYFAREFCPGCGSRDAAMREAGGRGVVFAVTKVTRAPTKEWKAHVPYTIVLVDAAEGFRLMAHGDGDLQIGDRVRLTWSRPLGQPIPYFTRP